MIDKIVKSAADHFNVGGIVQLSSMGLVLFGYEFDLNSLAIMLGVFFSGCGLAITYRQSRIANQLAKKELELVEKELNSFKDNKNDGSGEI